MTDDQPPYAHEGIIPAGTTLHELTFRLAPPVYDPPCLVIPYQKFQPGRVVSIEANGTFNAPPQPFSITLKVKSPDIVLSSDDIRTALKRMLEGNDND